MGDDDGSDQDGSYPPDGPPRPALGESVYNVVWSAVALEVVVLLGHLAGKMLFGVEDLRGVLASLLGFSLLIWVGATLFLIPIVVASIFRRLAEAAAAPGPVSLHDPWIDD